jgi:hypothetical protein
MQLNRRNIRIWTNESTPTSYTTKPCSSHWGCGTGPPFNKSSRSAFWQSGIFLGHFPIISSPINHLPWVSKIRFKRFLRESLWLAWWAHGWSIVLVLSCIVCTFLRLRNFLDQSWRPRLGGTNFTMRSSRGANFSSISTSFIKSMVSYNFIAVVRTSPDLVFHATQDRDAI